MNFKKCIGPGKLRVAVILASLFQVTLLTFAQQPPTTAQREETIKPLLVMVKAQFPNEEQEQIGAGIIFGRTDRRIYIVTANHLVRKGISDAQKVRVQFKWLPGESFEAKLLENASSDLDLAVLAVPDLEIPANAVKFDQLGDPSSLNRGDPVYLIGNPRGNGWRVYVGPDRISEPAGTGIFLRFESSVLAPGHSGGALLNEKLQVVGMTRTQDQPDGEAVSIRSVMSTVSQWGYPVELKESNSGVIKFRFFYRFGDNPGDHIWTKVNQNTWTESHPNGDVVENRVTGRINVGGDEGTLLENTKDTRYEYFIPDKGGHLMWLRIRLKGGEWGFLGEMLDMQ